jgi:hypothetical protein
MKTFDKWLKDNRGVSMPEGNVNASWFAENGFPMIVECTCCGMTMALPNAMIDDDGNIYCCDCADE